MNLVFSVLPVFIFGGRVMEYGEKRLDLKGKEDFGLNE